MSFIQKAKERQRLKTPKTTKCSYKSKFVFEKALKTQNTTKSTQKKSTLNEHSMKKSSVPPTKKQENVHPKELKEPVRLHLDLKELLQSGPLSKESFQDRIRHLQNSNDFLEPDAEQKALKNSRPDRLNCTFSYKYSEEDSINVQSSQEYLLQTLETTESCEEDYEYSLTQKLRRKLNNPNLRVVPRRTSKVPSSLAVLNGGTLELFDIVQTKP